MPKVRLVGDNIENPGIYATSDAMKLADELDLDLVEISPNADPPVCKVMDYQKFIYQQKRKQKEIKANTVKVVVKEIRFGPNTDDHDYQFKLRHAEKFLAASVTLPVSWFRNTMCPVSRSRHHRFPKGSMAMAT